MEQTSKEPKFMVRVRAIIFYKNKLFVLRVGNNTNYALPGGHLEYKENVIECLKREIVEELGVEPKVGRLLYVNNFIEESRMHHSVEFFFEVTNGEDYLDINNLKGSHSFEVSNLSWVGKEDKPFVLPKQLQIDLENGTILSDNIRFIK